MYFVISLRNILVIYSPDIGEYNSCRDQIKIYRQTKYRRFIIKKKKNCIRFSKPTGSSAYIKKDSKDIWSEEEVAEGSHYDDLADPRPQPE